MAYTIEWHITLKRPGYSLATRSVVVEARTKKDAKEIINQRHRYTGDGKVWTIKKMVEFRISK